MNTLINVIQRIKAALIGSLTNAQTARPAPARVKLATRNGYGKHKNPPPSR